MQKIRRPFLFIIALLTFVSQANACDLCSIYNALDKAQPSQGAFRFGLAEQFSSFGKVQDDGHHLKNEGHQHMESSNTQLFGAYDLSESFGLQLNVPYISRRFKRIENEEIDRGTEAGIGDISLITKYIPYEYRESEDVFFLQLFAGLKFATGSSDRIAEELGEGHAHGDLVDRHAEHEHGHGDEDAPILSSIHGHDLALGSGSYDFPLGLNLYAESGRTFATASVQYVIRTRGDFDYEYADDILWDVGPAYYLVLCPDYTVALRANLSGEHKGMDNLSGELQGDTGITSNFIGPEIILTAGDFSADIAWDIPLDINNTGVQSVNDYKLRFALSYRF